MAQVLDAIDRCSTCGAEAAGTHAYCHFYTGDEPQVYCSPDCAQQALRGGRPEAKRVQGDYLRELVNHLRWERGN